MTTTKTKPQTVDAYISSFHTHIQELLQTLRQTIKAEIPQVEEAISYDMPTFKWHGHYVIYFAAWKKHLSLYPFSADMEQALPETSAYKTSGKGTIQFPLDQPLPLPLIRKIVQLRLKEQQREKKEIVTPKRQ